MYVVSNTAKPKTPVGTALARQQWECVRQYCTLGPVCENL